MAISALIPLPITNKNRSGEIKMEIILSFSLKNTFISLKINEYMAV
jgi:hypothetical protein